MAGATVRRGSVPAHPPSAADFERLVGYPFVVVSWIDDAGYPLSVATEFETDTDGGLVGLRAPAGDGLAIPTYRDVNLIGSHIRPRPGEG
ncbi:MAG: hypothetical protein ACRDGH_09005, partial [Candidatus Limnocylindria bacterium]